MWTKLLIVVMFLFCSLSNKRTSDSVNSDSVLKIDLLPEPGASVKKLSEFAANIEYIPLQTMENSLMGGFARKIVRIENRIYIHNRDEILCFDIAGKFLFKLKNTGRGPEEYTIIADFDISSDNKKLTVLSRDKLLVYGISDSGFTFQRSISLREPVPIRVSFVPETDNFFLAIPPWTGTEPALSLLISAVGETIHIKPNCYKYNNVKKTSSRATNEALVYSIDKLVCFKEEFSDTVFYVSAKDKLFKPRIIFDSHGNLFTPEMKGSPEKPGDHTTYIANIFETSRYVFYWYGTMVKQNCILFDKTTKTKFKLDFDREIKSKINDDLSGGPDFNIDFLNNYCSGGNLFSLSEAITLKKYVAGDEFKTAKVSDPKRKNNIKKLADSLKETDNPVLIIVTPKN